MSRLCLILAEKDLGALERKLVAHRSSCPVLEVRLDFLNRPEIPAIPAYPRPALIATCRRPEDGGVFRGSEAERLALLAKAARNGFDWIDLEGDAEDPPDLPSSVRVVRSYHNLTGFRPDLDSIWSALGGRRADVRKMAVRVDSTDQLTRLLGWMEQAPGSTACHHRDGAIGAAFTLAWFLSRQRVDLCGRTGRRSLPACSPFSRPSLISGWFRAARRLRSTGCSAILLRIRCRPHSRTGCSSFTGSTRFTCRFSWIRSSLGFGTLSRRGWSFRDSVLLCRSRRTW